MHTKTEDRAIVLICSKKDYYLAKICVASIRYFYPEESIFLIKDKLQGDFSTTEIEAAFNVAILDLGIDKLGWGAGKLHFLLSNLLPNKRVLLLDGDIVFLGKFIDQLFSSTEGIDFVVDDDLTEYKRNPSDPYVKKTYFDYEEIKNLEPEYQYPGYVFNTGQLIVRTGLLKSKDVIAYFDKDNYPYYKDMKLMPLVDQSILNVILPKKAQKKEISIATRNFMLWSDGEPLKAVKLDLIKSGTTYPYLIHYAGSFKSEDIRKMIRPDILTFFQNYYFSKVPGGTFKKNNQLMVGAFEFNKNKLVLQVKELVSKSPLNKSIRGIHKILTK